MRRTNYFVQVPRSHVPGSWSKSSNRGQSDFVVVVLSSKLTWITLVLKMADDRDKSDLEFTTADLQKRIANAFDIFDHESNKTVDVR